MTEAQIKQCIANWTAIINNASALTAALGQGDYFNYTYPSTEVSGGTVHAYPGLVEGILTFFVIPSQYDNGASDIAAHTAICPIVNAGSEGGLGTNRITSRDALLRISRWEKNYTTWVPQQVASEDGMFRAFDIETQDFEVNSVKMYLGLKSTPQATVVYAADLIVANQELTVVYDDYSRPVPPYSSVAAQSEFYLLS
jgi:hypothetical protein